MNVEVDRWLCAGHARCEEAAPELFRVNDESGIAEVIAQPSSADEEARAREAAASCPVRAITLKA